MVTPGYMGGYTKNPKYNEVCSGNTGHTETIKIKYNASEISFKQLVELFFYSHDPTTLNRQGNDIGSQYRSAIFFNDLKEKKEINKIISKIEDSNDFKDPIVTEVNEIVEFYDAEIEHHNFFCIR